MKKKKAKKTKMTDKKTTKKSTKGALKNELNPGQVLKDISALVEANADKLAGAVIGEGMKGQVSPVKYLFEMAHIYPQPPEMSAEQGRGFSRGDFAGPVEYSEASAGA